MEGNETNITCVRLSETTVLCDGEDYSIESILGAKDGLFWGYLFLYMFLVLFAGENSHLRERACEWVA